MKVNKYKLKQSMKGEDRKKIIERFEEGMKKDKE